MRSRGHVEALAADDATMLAQLSRSLSGIPRRDHLFDGRASANQPIEIKFKDAFAF